MARVLDLNTYEKPVLEVVLQDEAHTKVRVTTPSEGLVRELEAVGPEVVASYKTGDKDSIEAGFELAAKLISCNLDRLTITPAELRSTYKMEWPTLVVFLSGYLDFINELTNAKN